MNLLPDQNPLSRPPEGEHHAMSKAKNAFYAQSGGVTAVINASACGVIETARQHRDRISKVYAGRNGIIWRPDRRPYRHQP